MAYDFKASKPIYMQIAEHIYQQIVRGEIKPGDKLASVRDMAIQTGVNPNTIQRSYSEMERLGVVETRRGQGTFVVNSEQLVSDLKQQLQRDIMTSFVKSMSELGFTKQEIVAGLEVFLKGDDLDDH